MIPSNTHTSPIDISRKHNMPTPSLCQGFQSCLEPLLLEPRVLMVPPKPLLSFPWPHKILDSNTTAAAAAAAEKAYVHPFSNSFLSTKSLEMCTESLGSETGSGIDEFPYLYDHSPSSGATQQPQKKKAAAAKAIKKVKRGGESSFPPPLTSISGSGGVQVQTHREGGRLVIKAFTVSSSSCRFQAERGNGRLRLSLLREGCGGGNEEEADRDIVDGGGDGFGGHISAEWASSRCNGDRSSIKGLQSLPFCVAIS